MDINKSENTYAFWFGALQTTIITGIKVGSIKKNCNADIESFISMVEKSGTELTGIIQFKDQLKEMIRV